MTARQVFESTLIELSKIQAPSLKLYEFNYLFNKAINQYINKVYNVYDLNQQTTDDLRVLKATAFLTPHKVEINSALNDSAIQHTGLDTKNQDMPIAEEGESAQYNGNAKSYLSKAHRSIQSLHGATYEVYLPIDYLHMLNCVCIYYVAKQKDCWDAGSYIEIPATRLTADSWSSIITDIYNRPSPMRPYYYIHNLNQNQKIPTDPLRDATTGTGLEKLGNDIAKFTYEVTRSDGNEGNVLYNVSTSGASTGQPENSNFQRTYSFGEVDGVDQRISLVEKPIAARIGNTSNVRCEIRYGKDDSLFQLAEVQVDYVKCPQFIRLTQEQIDLTEDTSQIMEFPDYVNQEIINELVHLVMERVNDPRLSNNMQISNTIARPTGQQAAQPTTQAQA